MGLALLWHLPQNLQRYVLKYAYFVPQLYVHSFDLIVVLDLITSLVVIDNLHHFVHHSLKVPRCLPHHPRTQALLAFELKQELLVAEASLALLVEQALLVPLEESVQSILPLEMLHIHLLLKFHLHIHQRTHLSFGLIMNDVFLVLLVFQVFLFVLEQELVIQVLPQLSPQLLVLLPNVALHVRLYARLTFQKHSLFAYE